MEEKKQLNKWTILIVVIIMTFMCTLDGSIVNVALPNMANVLSVSSAGIQFVATSYLIVIAGIILIFGKLGDMFGKTRTFTFGVACFTFGSLLCGLSYSFEVLIIARIIQAIGAAAAMANNQGIITETFPANERGKALGLLGTAVALGALVGPGLGGIIVGSIGWEYIFFINVPIGIFAAIAANKIFPRTKRSPEQTLDIPGAAFFLISMVSLFVSLNEGVSRGFSNPIIIAGFVIALVSFIIFIIIEKRKKDPLIQFQIFQNRLFTVSIICGFISYVAMFCHNIILPFYLQDLRLYTPTFAGLVLMVYPLVLTVVSPISGFLSDKIGSEFLTFIGLFLASVGLFLMALVGSNTSIYIIIVIIGIMSVGMGMFQPPNNSIIMSTIPINQLGIAGSINALIRNVGMVCGIAFSTTLLYSMMSYKIGERVTEITNETSSAFIFGMHIVYIFAGLICIIGAIITLIRMLSKNKTVSE